MTICMLRVTYLSDCKYAPQFKTQGLNCTDIRQCSSQPMVSSPPAIVLSGYRCFTLFLRSSSQIISVFPSWFPSVSQPALVLCFLPKISTFLPPGHIRSIISYASSGFRDVSRTSETMTSVSRPRLIHEGNLSAGGELELDLGSWGGFLTPTSMCSLVWLSQCPVLPVLMTRWS